MAQERTLRGLAGSSATVRVEFNYILNPKHADFGKITIATRQAFEIDPRLIAGPVRA